MAALREATLGVVKEFEDHGITVGELRTLLDVHHGSASSALSTLHKKGEIARLSDRRDKNRIYVVPAFVNGRTTEQQGRTAA